MPCFSPGNEAFEHNKPTFSATKRSFIPFLLRNGLNPLAGSANLTNNLMSKQHFVTSGIISDILLGLGVALLNTSIV